MATLQVRIQDLAVRIATESKSVRTLINGNAASLASLTTTAKTNLVAAINEVKAFADSLAASGGATINDASSSSTVQTYSITKILAVVAAEINTLKTFFDTNGDGKVNSAINADAVPWTGVSGKPLSFAPAAHDANLITTGTIDIARLPVLPGTVQIVSSGGIAALTAPQQTEIGDGSVVTTTDGRRWIYTGTGSKTVEASYIEMADVTPEWTTIANKPSTTTGYGITDLGNTDTNFVTVFEAGLL